MIDHASPADPSRTPGGSPTGRGLQAAVDPAAVHQAAVDEAAVSEPPSADAVQVRTLLAGPLPLLVAALGGGSRSVDLRNAVATAGLHPLSGFIGAELPRGAKVGFVVEGAEFRLVDERDDALLRAARSGLDEAWLEAALARKGTLFVVVDGMDLDAAEPAADLAQRIDEQARSGHVIGAIVGVIEERPKLPLLF